MGTDHFQDKYGGLNSVYPCYAWLTFGPWLYLVPQYKPKSVLMLGYAGGTVAGLIRLFYGDIPIVGVDIGPVENNYGVEIVKEDARKYVKHCDHYDSVIVDMFEDGAGDPCDFIFHKDFADDLKGIGNYIIIHAGENSDLSVYTDIRLVKMLALNRSRFYYFRTCEIHSLPIL